MKQKKMSLLLKRLMAVVSIGMLTVGHSFAGDSFIEKTKKLSKEDIVPATTVFASKDLMMLLGGRVRNEYLNLGRAQTFSKCHNVYDNQSLARLKASWLVGVQQGRRTYDRPAIEGGIKLTHYAYWQDQTFYIPIAEEALAIRDLDNAQIGAHAHSNVMPLVFMEDAFLKVHLDPFIKSFESVPTYIQAGMFPYMLGRGLSLGSYSDGGIPHMGWELNGDVNTLEQSPAGLLIHSELSSELSVELYYTKFREVSATRRQTASPTRLSRLTGERPERGIDKDRELWSGKLEYNLVDRPWGSLLLQPYVLYARAPEQQIEMPADASTKLWTLGMMVDYKYKGLTVNAEFAANNGHQQMHGIDRNQVILKRDKDDGKVREVFSHIYVSQANLPGENGLVPPFTLCDGTALQKEDGSFYAINSAEVAALAAENMPVMDVPNHPSTPVSRPSIDLLNIVNLEQNRYAGGNGKQLVREDGSNVVVDLPLNQSSTIVQLARSEAVEGLEIGLGRPFSELLQDSNPPIPALITQANNTVAGAVTVAGKDRVVVNSNLLGQKRFRDPYKIKFGGFMALLDIAYEFEDRPFKLAVSGHWISGDKYPYNTECDKTYKGFMTLRDYNYVGYEVPIFALLYARVLPRPLNIANSKYYAYNHYQDASNLRTLGAGITWFPVKGDREKSKFMFNAIACWNDCDLYKWDKKGCPKFDKLTNFAVAGGTTSSGTKIDGIRDKLGFTGWQSTEKASHFLGVELNIYFEYCLFPNCKVYTIDGIFIPGQLYRDVQGQPNRNSRTIDVTPGKEGNAIYRSLGDDIAYGFNVGMRFAF